MNQQAKLYRSQLRALELQRQIAQLEYAKYLSQQVSEADLQQLRRLASQIHLLQSQECLLAQRLRSTQRYLRFFF